MKNTTTLVKVVRTVASNSDIRDIAIHVNHVYGRNIVMVSAVDARSKSEHWAVSTATCGNQAKNSIHDPEENHSNGCPSRVIAATNRLALALGMQLTPDMGVEKIRDVFMNWIAFPCWINITNKCHKVAIEVRHETTVGNSSAASKKDR